MEFGGRDKALALNFAEETQISYQRLPSLPSGDQTGMPVLLAHQAVDVLYHLSFLQLFCGLKNFSFALTVRQERGEQRR